VKGHLAGACGDGDSTRAQEVGGTVKALLYPQGDGEIGKQDWTRMVPSDEIVHRGRRWRKKRRREFNGSVAAGF